MDTLIVMHSFDFNANVNGLEIFPRARTSVLKSIALDPISVQCRRECRKSSRVRIDETLRLIWPTTGGRVLRGSLWERRCLGWILIHDFRAL
jgi:hypothetical protein